MSIKTQFVKTQREMLTETIETADLIAIGQTDVKRLNNDTCRRLGDQFAACSAVLDMCADGALRNADSPAVVGLYRRLARDYRCHSERALMICGQFESRARATMHIDQLRHMMRGQLRHFEIEPRILLEASIQQVDLDAADGPLSCQPTG